MSARRRQLGEILMAHGLVTKDQLESALEEQTRIKRPLGQILIASGHITRRQLIQVLAAQRGIGCWSGEDLAPDPALIEAMTVPVCLQHGFLPIKKNGDLLVLAMADSEDIEAIDLARNLAGCRIQPVLADRDELLGHLSRIKANATAQPIQRREFAAEARALAASMSLGEAKSNRTQLTEEDTKPVESLVNGILADAIRKGATDVHLEPDDKAIQLRFRLDGLLSTIAELPSELHPMVTARIKIMAGLDIVEYRVPQDGQVNVSLGERAVDMRVSVIPGHRGPRIVLRLLDHGRGVLNIERIGLSSGNMGLFQEAISRPYGFFVVSGPTGSGKTTTLYAALNHLVDGTRNILTAENPVEYGLPGVSQTQVNEKLGVTFASLLRSFLRQDPDVIMVGEIRDEETAKTALRAAMTGHLVFATLHANDAVAVVPRLVELGLERSLLASCLIGTMAQRLVRTLCASCRRPAEGHTVGSDGHLSLDWEALGCPSCGGTGFAGRIAIHELMYVDDNVSKNIAEAGSLDDLRCAAYAAGMRNMAEDGLAKVQSGLTTRAELARHVWLNEVESSRILRSDRLAAS